MSLCSSQLTHALCLQGLLPGLHSPVRSLPLDLPAHPPGCEHAPPVQARLHSAAQSRVSPESALCLCEPVSGNAFWGGAVRTPGVPALLLPGLSNRGSRPTTRLHFLSSVSLICTRIHSHAHTSHTHLCTHHTQVPHTLTCTHTTYLCTQTTCTLMHTYICAHACTHTLTCAHTTYLCTHTTCTHTAMLTGQDCMGSQALSPGPWGSKSSVLRGSFPSPSRSQGSQA